MDVVAERERAQACIGYLPGDFVAYPHMTGEQYLRYLANLRRAINGGVDRALVQAMAKWLDLDLSHRVGALSPGLPISERRDVTVQ